MIFAAGWYPRILPGGNFVDGKKQQVFRRKPAVNVDRKENQRLENWGARRAAFRPYYFFFGSEKVLVCLYFSDRDSNLTPNLTPTGVSHLRQETTALE